MSKQHHTDLFSHKLCKLSKIILFLTIVLMLALPVNNQEIHKCETDEDCLNYYNCRESYCIHKDIFPFTMLEILMLLFFSSMSVVATTAGIGGGAVYSAIIMFVENFSAMEAFPISNFVILFCALSTFYIGVKNKRENKSDKFIDYDLVVVFVPIMLLGTKVGVLFNKIFPGLVLSILLILSLAFSCYKTYQK